jgi:hypothetical protein
MTTETRTAATVIASLDRARAEFLEAIDGLPDTDLTKTAFGQWSVKDLIAHVSSWDEIGATDLERASRGHIPALMSFNDEEIDDWNASLMRGRLGFTLPQVQYELSDRRKRLIDALNGAPEALVAGPLVARLTTVLIEHDTEHAEAIKPWRQS